MTVTARVSRRPIEDDKVKQALNKEIVPALRELIDESNASDHEARITALETTTADHETRLDGAEALLVTHETRIDALETAPYESDFGDGVATTFNFTHGFGTHAVEAEIWDVATHTRQVGATESTPDVNTYRVVVAVAPSASQYHIAIARKRG